jgi:hypothetical protein
MPRRSIAPSLQIDFVEASLQIPQRRQDPLFISIDPLFGDLLQRSRIQVMAFVTASPERDDQVGGYEKGKMLSGSLPGHVEALAELAQGLTVLMEELIEQFPAVGISQSLEDSIH